MMVRTQVLFPEEMLSDLRAVALFDNSSVSEVLRGMVKEKMFKRPQRKKSGTEGLLALVKIAKKYKNRKVPANLSVGDDYVYKLQ